MWWGADLICFIGADQIHPEDMFPRLVKRFDEGCEVVTCLVPARGWIAWKDHDSYTPVAYRFKNSSDSRCRKYRSFDLDGDMIEIVRKEDGDLQIVNFIGSGVLMFHRDHVLSLKRPWFTETYVPETLERTANMDSTFVWRLQMEAYVKVWVDTTITIKHLDVAFIDETYQEKYVERYLELAQVKGG